MERARQFVSAILAGAMIGMGGIIYLSCQSPLLGAFLFAVGLYTVVVFQLHLYTGKIGYLVFQKPDYLIELAVTWLGNLTGTFLIAKAVQATRIFGKLDKVYAIVDAKLADNFVSLFWLSVFCGALMFIAVEIFKVTQGSGSMKVAAIFVPVAVFILGGFEHVVANMFYFSLADVWSGHAAAAVIVMTLGNSVGGLCIPAYQKLFRIKK